MSIGLALFILYLGIMVGVGLVAARFQKTSADFWVANRSIGLAVLVMANMAAIMHGGSILSGVALMGNIGGVAGLPYLAFVGVMCQNSDQRRGLSLLELCSARMRGKRDVFGCHAQRCGS